MGPPKMQRGTMYPVRSKPRADDNVPFRDLMAAIVDRQDLNAKYLQRLAEERKRGPLPGKGNGQTPQNRVNKQMVLDPSAKTPQVVTENHHSFPKIEQTTKQKKKEPNGISYSDHEKSPYDKMEAVRSYARRREQIVTHEKSEQAVRGQKPSELLDAASVDSGCSSDKSTDGDMKRVERILQSIHVGRTRAGVLPKDARAARRLHYVVAHGPSNAPQKKPKLDNMNRFYTPSLDSKSLSHPRTKSVPSSWEPHGELKVHPKYRTPSDGVCKYYCRNYPDYLREMQMEKLLKKQRVLHKTAERSPVQETDGVLGCDLSELVKPSSPNKYNQDYSFACVNVKNPVRLPKLMDKVSGDPDSPQNGGIHTGPDRRNNRKNDQAVMSSKDIVNLRTKIRTNCENGPRLPGQYGSSDNVSGVPLRIPCPPQSTGMQKYFDRGTNEARIKQGYGTVTYTANPRATGYVNGGVISYRGGKETVYMLKELGEANPTRTPENTAYGSQADNDRGLVSGATNQTNSSADSPTGTTPVIVPVSRKTSGGDFCHQEVEDRSRWVGRIYQNDNTVVQRQGNVATQPMGQNDVQGQTSKTNVNSSPDISVPNIDQPVVVTGSVRVDDADTKTVDSPIVVEQGIDNSIGRDNGVSQCDGMTSLLSVPMLHAERIRTLEEGFEGKDGDLSIPEIRMITATPLPPDYEA